MEPSIWARPVVVRGQPAFHHGHAHRVGDALAQRPGGHLHARGHTVLRVARRAAAQLAELLQFVQRQVVAGEMQRGVQHHRGVARGEDKTVTVRPPGVGRIVLEKAVKDHIGQGGRTHRCARVPGIRFLDRVHRQEAESVDTAVDQFRPILRVHRFPRVSHTYLQSDGGPKRPPSPGPNEKRHDVTIRPWCKIDRFLFPAALRRAVGSTRFTARAHGHRHHFTVCRRCRPFRRANS